jgi:hypothetical protein
VTHDDYAAIRQSTRRAQRAGLLLVALNLGSALGYIAACHATPNIKTPEGQIAYRADQVVLRVNDLQATTIAAEQAGDISTDMARVIIQTCVSMNETLKTTPAGWQTTVRTAWAEMKFLIGVVTNRAVNAALSIVDAILEALL